MDPKRTDVIVHSRAYLTANIFEAFVGFLGLIASIGWAISPPAFQSSAIHDTFGNWAYLWLGVYSLSGAGILYGLKRVNLRVEVASLVLFGSGTIINIIALMTAFGPTTTLVSTSTLVAAAGTCFKRAWDLTRKRVAVVVEDTT